MAKRFANIPAEAQAAIMIAVVVALSAGFFFYGIPGVASSVWSLSAKKESLQKQVAKLKAENDKNEAFRQQQAEYLNRIRQLETQLATLRSIVPDEQATDEFMKMVFEAGAATDINIRTFLPKDLVARELYMEMPFTLRLDGTYYALLNFFDRLAHEQRIVSVTGLSLGTPQGGGKGNYTVTANETVGANCVVTTYFNIPQGGAPPPKKK
jgi:type IV pilus assembly protein PilO